MSFTIAVIKRQDNIWLDNFLWKWIVRKLASCFTLKDPCSLDHMVPFWCAYSLTVLTAFLSHCFFLGWYCFQNNEKIPQTKPIQTKSKTKTFTHDFFSSKFVDISSRPLIPPSCCGTTNCLAKRLLRACVSYSLECNQSLKKQGSLFFAVCLKPRLLWISVVSAEAAMRRGRKLRWGNVCPSHEMAELFSFHTIHTDVVPVLEYWNKGDQILSMFPLDWKVHT